MNIRPEIAAHLICALEALPVKELGKGALMFNCLPCALGAMARHANIHIPLEDVNAAYDPIKIHYGMTDNELDEIWEFNDNRTPWATPQDRFQNVYNWAKEQLK